MANIILFLLFSIIIGICIPAFYKARFQDNVTEVDIVKDAYFSNIIILYLILKLIYSIKISFTVIFVIFFILWLIYKIFLMTNKGRKLEKDFRFYKKVAVPAPFIGIVFELYIFITKAFEEIFIASSVSQFKVFASISIFLLAWVMYFSSQTIVSFLFKKRDNFRKAYIIGEVILVLIYAAFTIYYIFNTNLLTFL